MVENSLFVRGFIGLMVFIRSIYEHSLIKRCIDGLFDFFVETFRYSILYPIFNFRELDKASYPNFMKKLQSVYAWFIDGLHHVYERGVANSKIAGFIKKLDLSNWVEGSFFGRLIGRALKGASIEGLMICTFGILVPFIDKTLSLVLAFVIFGLFILSAIIKGNSQFKITKTTVVSLFYFVMLMINSFMSINPSGSMRDLGIHAGGLLVMFAIINSPLKKKDYKLIMDGLILAGILTSLFGIYQYIAKVPMGSGWVDVSQNPGLTVRSFATFENPNTFAEFLIMTLPFVIARALQCFHEKKWVSGFFFGIPAGLMTAALLMTASRAGWLGFAFGSVVFVLLINMKFIIPMVIGGLGMIPLLPASILNRISTIGSLSDSSNLYRFNLWKSSVEIIQDFLVTGIGTGYLAFRAITPYYMKNMAPYHTHNTYIQTLVEFGIIGLILFLTWCFLLFKDGANTAQKSKDYVVRLYGAAVTAGFCSVLLHGVAEHILYYSKIMLLFWVFVGLIIKAKDLNEDNQSM